MAREPLYVRIELTTLHCYDEGDRWGSAEPYLWVVYFKVDGATVTVSSALTLTGEATVQFTPGSHSNLGDHDVDAGDTLQIPSTIGQWQTTLRPIPVPASLQNFAEDVGGVAGVALVLMEEDNVTDQGAEAGHDGLNAAVREAINTVVATRTITNQEISDAEIAAFAPQVVAAAKAAIEDQQNLFENIWSWLNPDDTIGFSVFTFTHDELADKGAIPFSQRWENEGDWEIEGAITATRICPADVLQDIFDRLLGVKHNIEVLRRFRDGVFGDFDGLVPWWNALERNLPSIARVIANEPDLRQPASDAFGFIVAAAGDLEAPLDEDRIIAIEALVRQISSRTRSRRLRMDASRLADALVHVRGETVQDGISAFARIGTYQTGRRGGSTSAAERILERPLGLDHAVAEDFRNRYLMNSRLGRYLVETYFTNEDRLVTRASRTEIPEADRRYAQQLYETYAETLRQVALAPERSKVTLTAEHVDAARRALRRAEPYLEPDEVEAAREAIEVVAQFEGRTPTEALRLLDDEELLRTAHRLVDRVAFLDQPNRGGRKGAGTDNGDFSGHEPITKS